MILFLDGSYCTVKDDHQETVKLRKLKMKILFCSFFFTLFLKDSAGKRVKILNYQGEKTQILRAECQCIF